LIEEIAAPEHAPLTRSWTIVGSTLRVLELPRAIERF
jgi:hypothetical protein